MLVSNASGNSYPISIALAATYGAGGERNDSYTRFEALLVNKRGWLMVMEYQKSEATADEWEALK